MPHPEDPVLRNARREGWIITAVWLAAAIYCCVYSYIFGYDRPGQVLGQDDLDPVLGVPNWFAFGVMLPWFVCSVFTLVFAGFLMVEDDLGTDHAQELDRDIREEAALDV
jgi:hypothetical protein